MSVEISQVAQDEEIELVAQLAKEIWTEYYTPIMGSDQVVYMIDKFQTAAAIKDRLAENYEYYLAKKNNEPVGYFAIQSRKNDELFLSNVYVLADLRGGGIGRRCLAFISNRAKELNLATISLTVNKHNSDTLLAYEKWGFSRTRAVVTDIGGGFVMDDWEYKISV